jgi:hypothetical protein
VIFLGANFQLLVKQKIGKNWKFSFFGCKVDQFFFLKIIINLVEKLGKLSKQFKRKKKKTLNINSSCSILASNGFLTTSIHTILQKIQNLIVLIQ